MLKDYLNKVIASKEAEERDIREKIKSSDSADEVRALGEKLNKVLAEANEAREQLAKVEEPTKADLPKEQRKDPAADDEFVKVKEVRKINETVIVKEETKMDEKRKLTTEQIEERAKAYKEGRSVTVGASNILLPQHQSSELAPVPFRQVSTFVDLTKVRNLQGGESYEAPFTKTYGEGGLTAEGADYTTAEPEFDKVRIDKVKITAYAEISEELEKLPSADYVAEVEKGVAIAIKKKLAKEQINGTGASNSLTGILSTAANNACVLAADDLVLTVIDADTLNQIIFKYGGDEEVEQKGVLVLNKADLLAFSLVKNENGEHAYKIDLANQTINTVPYVISSNCKALSDTATAKDSYTMFYGIPQHYETAVFSPIEIMKSYDYKFKQGMIAYKASAFVGGNTTSYRGFIRIKKGEATA